MYGIILLGISYLAQFSMESIKKIVLNENRGKNSKILFFKLLLACHFLLQDTVIFKEAIVGSGLPVEELCSSLF